MFWRKRVTISDPVLGTLAFWRGKWSGDATSAAQPFVAIQGTDTGPNPAALQQARTLMGRQGELAEAAMAFVRADEHGAAFIHDQGNLQFEGFTVTAELGEYTVELGLSAWADAMIDVRFKADKPVSIGLAD
jgi:hypothetical protein